MQFKFKLKKVPLSFSQIITMNIGFFGIQYSFGLQQTAINPIYSFLGANPEDLPLLNLAGPVTGLLIQPLIGAISDRTWHPRWGRRKPFFMIGAIMCSICLFLFPFSQSLWMAVGLLWLLDAANNTAMEPYRAFVTDILPEDQQPKGFLTQSFFTGLGITLANLSLFGFQKYIGGATAAGIPYWVFGSFFLGSICSITSVMYSVSKTPEIQPSEEEMAFIRSEKGGFFKPIHDIFSAIKDMPKSLWQLASVYLFQWYAMFCYWQFIAPCLAKSIWSTEDTKSTMYQEAVAFTGLVNGFYNIITFMSAFVLAYYAQKFKAKYVHALCLLWAGLSLLYLPQLQGLENQYFVLIPIFGFGVAWASMMGVPYVIVAADIPETRRGVYMGIINMMIVIPMIIQNLTFGGHAGVYKSFLGGDPTHAIMFAGVLLLIAAVLTTFIHERRLEGQTVVMQGGGGH
ncbi:MAG: MFS transporter [Saprospiraceae bacterium]